MLRESHADLPVSEHRRIFDLASPTAQLAIARKSRRNDAYLGSASHSLKLRRTAVHILSGTECSTDETHDRGQVGFAVPGLSGGILFLCSNRSTVLSQATH